MPKTTDSNGDKLRKGDLIEFHRPKNYQHWAIYDEDGYVIHVTTRASGVLPGVSAASGGLSGVTCGSIVPGSEPCVKREKLSKVIQGSNFYKKNLDGESPFQPQGIIDRAKQYIGKTFDYNLFKNNCEHFVFEMRYDRRRSEQVKKMLTVGVVVTGTLAWVGVTPVALGASVVIGLAAIIGPKLFRSK